MPAAADLLLEAVRRSKLAGEDRLTEIVASVLRTEPELSAPLFAATNLKRTSDEVEISTQVRLPGVGRLDMEIAAVRGHVVGPRVWVEHKLDAEFGRGQLERYGDEARRLYRQDCGLLVIARSERVREVEREAPNGWFVRSWQWLAEESHELGRRRGGPTWRQKAITPQAEARDRLLHELVSYLEREDDAVVTTLGNTNILVFSEMNETAELVEAILERAGRNMGCGSPYPVEWDRDDWGRCWITFDTSYEAWPAKMEGYPELTAVASDDWAESRIGEPAFAAGWTLPENVFRELSESSQWRTALDKWNFSLSKFAGKTRVFRTRYMAELVGQGATFDQQAKALGAWAGQSVKDLLEPELDPGLELLKSRNGPHGAGEAVSS